MKDLAKQVIDSLPSLRMSILRDTDRRLRGGATIGIARDGAILQETRDQRTGLAAYRMIGRYDGAHRAPAPKIDAVDSPDDAVSDVPERLDRK